LACYLGLGFVMVCGYTGWVGLATFGGTGLDFQKFSTVVDRLIYL